MAYFDIRFFLTGWRIGFGPLFIGWNHQQDYTEFRIGRLTSSDFKSAGGMTWSEWKRAKRDSAAAKLAAREAAVQPAATE